MFKYQVTSTTSNPVLVKPKRIPNAFSLPTLINCNNGPQYKLLPELDENFQPPSDRFVDGVIIND